MLNNKLASNIVDLEKKILKLYNELIKFEYQGNKKEFNETILCIQSCNKLEEKYYNQIDIKNQNSIYNFLSYDNDGIVHKRVGTILSFRIKQKLYKNIQYASIKYKSLSNDKIPNFEINDEIIYNTVLAQLYIKFIEELLQNCTNDTEKYELIKEKYNYIYINDLNIEDILFENIYIEETKDVLLISKNERTISNTIEKLLKNTDFECTKLICYLRANLYLANMETLNRTEKYFYNICDGANKNIVQQIENLYNEAYNRKQKKY